MACGSDDDFDRQDFECRAVDHNIPVYKYVSKRTGLRIVLAQVDGPVVNGFFCLATEAQDDDGLPHTLEHLIFLGSQDYPYKGVLDLLANRSFASGTNAWTDTDHTCYTMTTAGSEGFLNLMPIYLDHILHPTIKESGYVTEVHHVNGEGDDAGVVYCEMQARENSGESRTHLEMLRAMYPGNCGYRSETGGILHNLRTSTSHEKVKNYFKKYYQPQNLCLIITGMVEPQDVLEKVRKFEEKIISKREQTVYERPWQSTVEPLTEAVDKTVEYGCDDEETGMVTIAFRGPLASEQKLLAAVMLLFEYLTDTAVSPIQRDFVELDDPYCSEVRYSVIENAVSCIYLHFDNVPTEKLSEIKPRLFTLLESIAYGKEAFDMTRLNNIIHRQRLSALSSLEDSPHDTLAFHVIGEFIYGSTQEDMDLRLNNIETFTELNKEPLSFWIDLLNRYFVSKNYVAVKGLPSVSLMERLGEEETQRIARQKEELKEEGLALKQQELEAAIAENEIAPPRQMLTSVSVPDVKSIHFHELKPTTNIASKTGSTTEDCSSKFPLKQIPVAFQLDDIKTNFVTMTVLMDTSSVPSELRCYLPLYLEVILESPILRDGVIVSHQDVLNELTADTLQSSAALGIGGGRFTCGQFASIAAINIKVEIEKYTRGVRWLREFLYHVQFTPERLKIVANKMASDVAKLKRNGNKVATVLLTELNYKKDSNQRIVSMLRQQKFLNELIEAIDKDPTEAARVVEKMNALRELVTDPSRLRVHVAVNVSHLASFAASKNPEQVWISQFVPQNIPIVRAKHEVLRDSSCIEPALPSGVISLSTAYITGVGAVESSYLTLSTPCITDYESTDIPAILVYMQYLIQLEGPLWKQIRGLGLSYNYTMYMKLETGLLYFTLQKSSQLMDAYKQAKTIVESYLSGASEFEAIELESAKSSLIFELIEEEKTPAEASVQSMLSYLQGTSHGYHRRMMAQIPAVTVEDLRRVGKQYFSSLFDLNKSKIAICCHPNKVNEICDSFNTEFGKVLTVIKSLDDECLTNF